MTEKYPLSVSMTDFVNQSLSFFPISVVEQGIEAQRLAYRAMTSHFANPRPANLIVENKTIDGVRVRHYFPKKQAHELSKEGSNSLRIVFAHGGGWYLGDLDSHDSFCAHLASDCDIELIAIDYALAPESPYPEGLNDIEIVYQSLSANSSLPIVLMGDSAGANLMAALSLRCRRKALPVAYAQCFIYPALSEIGSLPSHRAMSDAPLLDTNSLDFCWGQYVPSQEPLVSNNEELIPLYTSTHASLPPTMLFAAEYDPLIDDARCYFNALIVAGVEAELKVISGLVHGGLHGFKITEEANKLYLEICNYVQLLAKKSQIKYPVNATK
jgi:acetyl esterase